jgi:epoxyqueuosine reductase QueG
MAVTIASGCAHGISSPRRSPLPDFDARQALIEPELVDLSAWDEATFAHDRRAVPFGASAMSGELRNVGLGLQAMPWPNPLNCQEDQRQALRQGLQHWASHTDPVVLKSKWLGL